MTRSSVSSRSTRSTRSSSSSGATSRRPSGLSTRRKSPTMWNKFPFVMRKISEMVLDVKKNDSVKFGIYDYDLGDYIPIEEARSPALVMKKGKVLRWIDTVALKSYQNRMGKVYVRPYYNPGEDIMPVPKSAVRRILKPLKQLSSIAKSHRRG